jgi:hypothetical protein
VKAILLVVTLASLWFDSAAGAILSEYFYHDACQDYLTATPEGDTQTRETALEFIRWVSFAHPIFLRSFATADSVETQRQLLHLPLGYGVISPGSGWLDGEDFPYSERQLAAWRRVTSFTYPVGDFFVKARATRAAVKRLRNERSWIIAEWKTTADVARKVEVLARILGKAEMMLKAVSGSAARWSTSTVSLPHLKVDVSTGWDPAWQMTQFMKFDWGASISAADLDQLAKMHERLHQREVRALVFRVMLEHLPDVLAYQWVICRTTAHHSSIRHFAQNMATYGDGPTFLIPNPVDALIGAPPDAAAPAQVRPANLVEALELAATPRARSIEAPPPGFDPREILEFVSTARPPVTSDLAQFDLQEYWRGLQRAAELASTALLQTSVEPTPPLEGGPWIERFGRSDPGTADALLESLKARSASAFVKLKHFGEVASSLERLRAHVDAEVACLAELDLNEDHVRELSAHRREVLRSVLGFHPVLLAFLNNAVDGLHARQFREFQTSETMAMLTVLTGNLVAARPNDSEARALLIEALNRPTKPESKQEFP